MALQILQKFRSKKNTDIVQKPWGSYEVLHVSEGIKIKRITVLPGGQLSLQMHHHRAEHWIVMEGIATVTIGADIFELTQHQHAFIPLQVKHRLQNLTESTVEIIELQTGSLLEEHDIVRLEDIYGRK